MPSLPELQRRFYDAVLLNDAAALDGLVRSGDLPAADRIDVYRNNAREGFRKALAADYPVIERLVGVNCFRGLARTYMREHPSRSGDLQGFGREFAAFLAERYGAGEYDYLADVARLEWAYQEVLVAADAQPIAVDRLAEFSPKQYDGLCLSLHPAIRLLRSTYPILRIWQANQPDAGEEGSIDLASGGEAVLLRRLDDRVELRRLDAGDWTLLDALHAGAPLGVAVDAAAAASSAFELSRALGRAFALGLVADCSISLPTNAPH